MFLPFVDKEPIRLYVAFPPVLKNSRQVSHASRKRYAKETTILHRRRLRRGKDPGDAVGVGKEKAVFEDIIYCKS